MIIGTNSKKEPKQIAKFWEPGNPDYDRIHEKDFQK
jgi:hypothetical protein